MSLSGGDEEFRLPAANEAERWEKLLPGSTDRLISIMEALTVTKIQVEKDQREQDRGLASVSLLGAFVLSLLLIVAAIIFFAIGNNVAGGLLIGVPSSGIAISFIPKAIAGRKDEDA
jgi:hypothetical protein